VRSGTPAAARSVWEDVFRARVASILAILAAALACADVTDAKEFDAVAVVGSRGDSIELRGAGVADLVFAGRRPARPLGGYLRLYPLADGGFVGLPGRFYPATGAVCLDWDQSRTPRDCRHARPRLARSLRALRLERFVGMPTTVRRLAGEHLTRPQLRQLHVVFELAFDRWKLARRARRPERCHVFFASWRGPAARARPTAFCLSARGVHARDRLYPLGRAPYGLVSGLTPRFWGASAG
jgi:hypothetical protein